jgi:hypothetical protein
VSVVSESVKPNGVSSGIDTARAWRYLIEQAEQAIPVGSAACDCDLCRLARQEATIDDLRKVNLDLIRQRDELRAKVVELEGRNRWQADRIEGLETQAEGLKQARRDAANRPSLEAIALRAENQALRRKLDVIGLVLRPEAIGADVYLVPPLVPPPDRP